MEKEKKSLVKKEYLVPFVLVTSLFFLWGFAHAILDVLNKHFQEAQGLIAAQGGFEVSDDAGFAQLMDRFTKDEAFLQASAGRAAAFVEKLTGATERVLQAVKPELEKNCQAQS